MKLRYLGILTILVMCLSACDSDNEPEIIKEGSRELNLISLDTQTVSVAEEIKDFYVRFTSDVASHVDNQDNVSSNVVVSPLSASMLLAMIANGVDDVSSSAILKYLGVSDLNGLSTLNSILLKELPLADYETTMSISNSIWVNKPKKLNSDYSRLISNIFRAEVFEENFSDNSLVTKAMNNWCKQKTNGKIESIVDKLDASSLAVLFNAVFFQSSWREEYFSKNNTKKALFYGSKGEKKVNMMKGDMLDINYSRNDVWEMITLIFGNRAFSISIIKPIKDMSLTEMDKSFGSSSLIDLRSRLHSRDVNLQLPRFEINQKISLDNILEIIGISNRNDLNLTMFDNPQKGFLSIEQGVSFKIDEDGATAASVSIGDLSAGDSGEETDPLKPVDFIVNRPFYFFVNEYSTDACIMSGRIADL